MEYGKILNGIKWTAIQTIVNRSASFIVKMILARLLFPEDYGIIGMAVVFTNFLQVFTDLGLAGALIQRDDDKITDSYVSTAFWTGLVWGGIIYLILYFIITPYAVIFFDEEELSTVLPILGLPVLINQFSTIQISLLTRNLNFKKIAFYSNTAKISTGIFSVLLALKGFGIWALIFQVVGSYFIEMLIVISFFKWRPSLTWDKEKFKDLFHYGSFTTLSGLVYRTYSQGDYLIIGKLLGKIQLGYYSFAFIMTDSLRIQVKNVIENVLFPHFARLKYDKENQFKLLCESVYLNTLIIVPIMVSFLVCSEWVVILFGEKWFKSLVIIKVIALTIILQLLSNPFSSIMRANDHVKFEFYSQLFLLVVVFLPAVYFGTKFYGILGTSYGVLFSRGIAVILNLFFLDIVLKINVKKLLNYYIRALIPGIISCISILILRLFIDSDSIYMLIAETSFIFLCSIFFLFKNNYSIFQNLKKTF